MARLILEEDGATRRFNLSQGKLTFGSSEKATLTLASDEVAALHGQIEMGDEGAVVRVAKGVQPVQVGGRAVQGAHVMKDGQAVSIGGAKLTVEYEEGEGPSSAPAPASRPVSQPGSRSGAARSGGGSNRSGSGRVQRKRPRAQRSAVPGWAIALLVLVGLGGLGYKILGSTAKNMAGDVFNFDVRYAQAERMKSEDPIQARAQFLEIRAQPELTPDQRKEVQRELDLLGDRLANVDDAARNAEIAGWLQSRVLDFFDTFPVTENRSYARLFHKRASWFLREYPTHEKVSKVERLLRRVTPVAELDEPATLEDLRIEVKGLTDKRPMNFPEAFAAIEKFIAETNDTSVQASAMEIEQQTRQAEKAFYELQLDKAAVVYDQLKYPDKYSPGQAFEDMVAIIQAVEDEGLKADAGRRMRAISEVNAGHLRGYKRNRTVAWAKMMEVPVLQEFARELGVEE